MSQEIQCLDIYRDNRVPLFVRIHGTPSEQAPTAEAIVPGGLDLQCQFSVSKFI